MSERWLEFQRVTGEGFREMSSLPSKCNLWWSINAQTLVCLCHVLHMLNFTVWMCENERDRRVEKSTALAELQAPGKFYLWPNNKSEYGCKTKTHSFLCGSLDMCLCVCSHIHDSVWLKSQCLLLFAAFFIVAAEKPQWQLLPCKQTHHPQISLCCVAS